MAGIALQVLSLIQSDMLSPCSRTRPSLPTATVTCEDGAVPRLVDDTALTELAVVANNTMSRERGLSGFHTGPLADWTPDARSTSSERRGGFSL